MAQDELGHLSEWSVEVEFLVAQVHSAPIDPSIEDHDDHDTRWTCPPDAKDPQETVAKYCAQLVHHHGQAPAGIAYSSGSEPDAWKPIVDRDGPRPVPRAGMDASQSLWTFGPARTACAEVDSPEQYEWVPVKVRSPFSPIRAILPSGTHDPGAFSGLGPSSRAPAAAQRFPPPRPSAPRRRSPETPAAPGRDPLPVESLLAVLRAGVKMHVNASCQMRVFFCHRSPGGLELVPARRMLTLCWMLEEALLLELRPEVCRPELDHVLPVTAGSRLAREHTYFPDGYMTVPREDVNPLLRQTRPRDPYGLEVMRHNIPSHLHDSCLQERLQLIWAADTMHDLSDLVSSPDGCETTIAIHVPDDDDDDDVHPTVELRYTPWHPQAESMQYWLQLLGQIFFFATGSDTVDFSERVREVDASLLDFKKLDPPDRWKCILTLMRLDNTFAYWWGELKKKERDGGCLSPRGLNRQGILPRVPGVDLLGIGEETQVASDNDWTYG